MSLPSRSRHYSHQQYHDVVKSGHSTGSLGENEVAALQGFWQCLTLDTKAQPTYLGNIVEGNIDDRSNKGSDSMGWDEVERSWNELKGEVKRQWSKLTDEDVEIIKGAPRKIPLPRGLQIRFKESL
jgi:hypothetical protein